MTFKSNIDRNFNQTGIRLDIILLSIYFFLTPFDQILNFGYGTVLKFIGIAFISIRLFHLITAKQNINFSDPIVFFPIYLIIISYLSAFWTIDIEATLDMSYNYLILEVMFIVVYLFPREFI